MYCWESTTQHGEEESQKPLKIEPTNTPASSNHSVTVGQGYSTIAWLPEEVGTWTLPLRHERITSHETPISKAAWQLKQVSKHLSTKTLVVLDSEYGNGSWVNQTEDIQVSKLMRIRSNCCFWSKPDGYSGKGRPRKHDQKFKVNDPTTWWKANETIEIEDPKLGKLKISQGQELHFRSSASHDMSLIRVERLNPRSSGKKPRSLWLVWVGEQFLELKDIWSQYARRTCGELCAFVELTTGIVLRNRDYIGLYLVLARQNNLKDGVI
ncbi:MAG: transposase [Pleurocapsa sp. MO_226.B13]|nr:transposase [Pleurocapsa sp. MO_226.B13]